ncbi:MAG: HPr kinase/phosphatase C-terminal domain-containing protein [Sphingobium sp.]|uniref:HPr kinase/phosphorylase n=1 Tax=Sphingobium sp. TaxID=1912891 RepID=UPI0029BC1A52|nr:HPr kinase/phosphatase C-terminal domain-containing protein [Sphingobium sp.]MDX3909663.1 HPr kinase/phosphatase C-terminal domain-containing protein [Sphingobium sp.]
MNGQSETLHGTTVALDGRAVLLIGPSGSGKSDLALRLTDRGADLVSDDYTVILRKGDTLIASAPENIAGKMEVRGIGIVEMPAVRDAPLALILDLAAPVQRYPDVPATKEIAGISVPLLPLSPFEASAPIKVALALRAYGLATRADDLPAAS